MSCRSCGGAFHPAPLLAFAGMPKAAQFLPGPEDLATERGVDLVVRQCAHCGLVQLEGEPVPYFREVIRASAFSPEMGAFRREQFRGFAERYGLQGKRVLEVGCGRGEYLDLLREVGMEARGLEAAPQNHPHVTEGFISEGDPLSGEAPFAAFFILSYLEHLPEPLEALRAIHAHLEEGALGLVEVPNFDLILEQELFSEFIPDHLCYFTEATLRVLLERAGFEVVACEAVWHRYILSATVRRREPLDLRAFRSRQEGLTRELQSFVRGVASAAVWGAGHQALALLALADLAPHLRYVVDSAPFKQGRYTPATHLPIRSPEALETDPVEAVLVMAASYSDEVAGILRERFGQRLRIGILRDWGIEIASPGHPRNEVQS
ncbi:class I SAM-dependent methyltransferase [Holophaga foetida]|uniref:class I SAM-dependent methyltransferase n=1 Tax=Holophaga foetida TaxID=35839 RepID=UPI00024749F1|nr:class I SAM-dependent methyltransferase [Holophaga foetida]